MGCTVTFALVTLGAGAGGIAPTIAPAPALGQNMIQGKIPFCDERIALLLASADATVDAAIAIALKDAASAPPHTALGCAHIAAQAQDCGDGQFPSSSRNVDQFFGYGINPLTQQEGKRTAGGDDSQRFITCIEQQNRIHDAHQLN